MFTDLDLCAIPTQFLPSPAMIRLLEYPELKKNMAFDQSKKCKESNIYYAHTHKTNGCLLKSHLHLHNSDGKP